MPNEIALHQVDPEKRERQLYLGSSDAAAILGVSPWRTPLDVYFDKTEPPRPDDPDRLKFYRRGKRMERYVIDLLEEETGTKIVQRNQRYPDAQYPFIKAEIDAENERGENCEIKTVSPFAAKEWGEQQTDEVPVHYTAQVMHGMMCKPAPRTLFGVLIGGDDFRIYRVERDEELIAMMREKEVEFWQRVIDRNPPPPTAVSDIIRMYGKMDAGTAIEATEEIMTDVIHLKRVKDQIKDLQEQEKIRETSIKLHMQDNAILLYKRAPLVTWKHQKARKFNESLFKEEHPELHEAHKGDQESRVFRVKLK